MQKNFTIDLITEDPGKGSCKLIAVAQGPWPAGETENQMRILQDKLYNYVDAAVDGMIAEKYPDFKCKSLIIRLDCYDVPRTEVEQFFNRFSEHIRNSTEIQAIIAQHHYIKDLSFEFSWASLPEAAKGPPVRPSLFRRLFGK